MTFQTNPIPRFNVGEVDPAMTGRLDLSQYAAAAREARNVLLLPHGGFRKRGGFRHLAEAKYHDRKTILVPFVYSARENYVIELGDRYARFLTRDGLLRAGTVSTTLSTWTDESAAPSPIPMVLPAALTAAMSAGDPSGSGDLFVGTGTAPAPKPAVAYSTVTPEPGDSVTATFSSEDGITAYQWQYWVPEWVTPAWTDWSGRTAKTLPNASGLSGWRYRISWQRDGVWEYPSNYVTVVASSVLSVALMPTMEAGSPYGGGGLSVTAQEVPSGSLTSMPTSDKRGPTTPMVLPSFADAYGYLGGSVPASKSQSYWDEYYDWWDGTLAGRTLTWSNYSGALSGDAERNEWLSGSLSATRVAAQRQAFVEWGKWLDVTFTEVTDAADVNIRCGLKTFSNSSIIGQAGMFTGSKGACGYNADLIDSYTPRTYLHEIGHVLGLAHPDGSTYGASQGDLQDTVMETLGHSIAVRGTLHVGDIIGAQHLWGSNSTAPRTAPDVVSTLIASRSTSNVNTALWTAPRLDGGEAVQQYRVSWHGAGNALLESQTVTTLTATYTSSQVARVVVAAENYAGIGLRKAAAVVPVGGTGPKPSITYSTTAPTLGSTLTATFSSEDGVTAYQWQVRASSASNWVDSISSGNTTKTITIGTGDNLVGFQYRITWTRYGLTEFASSHVTVVAASAPPPPSPEQPTVTYSTVSPESGDSVTATFSSEDGITAYQWQYWVPEWVTPAWTDWSGRTAKTLPNASGLPGRRYRISWQRDGVWEYPPNYVTVVAGSTTPSPPPTVTYSPVDPDQGESVTATFSDETGITAYQWQYWVPTWVTPAWTDWSGRTAKTLPNASGLSGWRYRISWQRDGVWEYPSNYVTVADTLDGLF